MRYQQVKKLQSNHAKRIVTASALILVILLAIYFLPAIHLVTGLCLIAYQGLDEWCHLAVPLGILPQKKIHYYALGIQLCALALGLVTVSQATQIVLQCVVPIVGAASYLYLQSLNRLQQSLGIWLIGLVLQSCGWYEAILLCQTNISLLVYLSLTTAVADIAGYYVGKNIAFFTSKPWPSVSPNKTYEGTIAMFVIPILVTSITAPYNIPLSLYIGTLALLGDLFISSTKRLANVKDCGSILPGHGGVLDRLDSHLMVWTMHGALRVFG